MNSELKIIDKKNVTEDELCCLNYIRKCFNIDSVIIYEDFEKIKEDLRQDTEIEIINQMKEYTFKKRNIHCMTNVMLHFLRNWLNKKYKILLVIADHEEFG